MTLPHDKDVPRLREPRYSQSVERGLAILESFRPHEPVLGIADLADELGMGRSTTHRYVVTLMALGFLEQGASRKYRLGTRSADIGRSFLDTTGLRTKSRPLLERLQRSTSHTAVIAVLDGRDIVCVNRARSYNAGESLLWLRLGTGARLPAHRTAMGKLLLAQLPKSELDAVAETIIAATPQRIKSASGRPQADGLAKEIGFAESAPKIRSRRALLTALREVRDQGYAVSDEEWLAGISEIAVPLRRQHTDESRDTGEICAALGVLARSATRSTEELVRDIRPQAEAAAKELAEQLDDDDPIL